MPRIKAVLFDKDGVLVDFNKTWGPAAHQVAARLANGHPARLAALGEAIGFVPGTTYLAAGSSFVTDPAPVYGRRWAAILEREATHDFFKEIDRLFAETTLLSLTPIAGAEAVIDRLAARGLILGLATNDAEANARQQMRRLGFDGRISFIAGYDSGHGAKPSPGMANAFAAHAGCAPAEVALVGDTLHDLECARAAGALAVATLTGLGGAAARERLAAHADLIIASLEELPAAIGLG